MHYKRIIFGVTWDMPKFKGDDTTYHNSALTVTDAINLLNRSTVQWASDLRFRGAGIPTDNLLRIPQRYMKEAKKSEKKYRHMAKDQFKQFILKSPILEHAQTKTLTAETLRHILFDTESVLPLSCDLYCLSILFLCGIVTARQIQNAVRSSTENREALDSLMGFGIATQNARHVSSSVFRSGTKEFGKIMDRATANEVKAYRAYCQRQKWPNACVNRASGQWIL